MRAMCRAKLIAVLVLMPAAIAFAQKPTSHKAGILETQVPAANPINTARSEMPGIGEIRIS
jgi:hypothetical protein